MKHTTPPLAYSIVGAAKALGTSERFVRDLIAAQELDVIRRGRLVRIEHEAITRWLDRHRQPRGVAHRKKKK